MPWPDPNLPGTRELLARSLHETMSRAEQVDKLVRGERRACAALVRAAGCSCEQLLVAEGRSDGVGYDGSLHMTAEAWAKARSGAPPDDKFAGHVHDRRCPHALADAIEARR